MTKRKIIGIDSGTSTSYASVLEWGRVRNVLNQDGEEATPSVVTITPNGEVLIGRKADSCRELFPKRSCTQFKRLMGKTTKALEVDGVVYSPQQLTSMVLRRVLDSVVEDQDGEEIPEDAIVTVTVPANFGAEENNAVFEAAKLAGLNMNNVKLLKEPVSAALYVLDQCKKELELEKEKELLIEVVDVGGGTTDLSVLSFRKGVITEITSGGNNRCGGEDVDQLFKAFVKSKFLADKKLDANQEQELTSKIRLAKETVSKRNETTFSLSVGEKYTDKVSIKLTRADLEQCLKHPCAGLTREQYEKYTAGWKECESYRQESFETKIVNVLREVDSELKKLAKENKELAGKNRPDLIILCGGTSRMPVVHEIVKSFFAAPEIRVLVKDPDLAVSCGAAIYGGYLAAKTDPKINWGEKKNSGRATEQDGKSSGNNGAGAANDSAGGSSGDSEVEIGSNIIKELKLVSHRSYGIKCWEESGDKVVNVLYRGSTLPVEKEEVFFTRTANQRKADLEVWENIFRKSDMGRKIKPDECTLLGICQLEIRGDLPEHSPIQVRLSMDESGVLQLHASEKTWGTEVSATLKTKALLSTEEFEKEKKQVDKLYEEVV